MVGETDIAGATRQIDMCLEQGVNMIDTANVYAAGKSEEIIGEVSAEERAERLLVATKVRFPMGDGPNDRGMSRHHIIAQCEASLKRLKTDVIDLYQVHQWDGQTPLEETIEALDTLVKQGKVRYVGCSNFSGWHLMKALAISEPAHLPALRLPADPLHAAGARGRIRAACRSPSTRVSASWSGARSPAACSRASTAATARPRGGRHAGLEGAADPRRGHALRYHRRRSSPSPRTAVSPARQVALAWLLGRPGVTSVVIGGRTDAQFADNLAAADLKLTDEEVGRLEKVSRPPLLYPYWHQNWTAADRLNKADLALHAPYLADKKA